MPLPEGENHWTKRMPERLWWRGERNWAAKLTPDKVRAMRQAKVAGRSTRGLARDYGVCPRVVREILRRVTWRHVA